jgi:hypothetical protein
MYCTYIHTNAPYIRRCVCACACVGVIVCINAEWNEKKIMMPGLVRYQIKPMQSQSGIFLIQYWTVIMDARMPIPALISSMPMPSYAKS